MERGRDRERKRESEKERKRERETEREKQRGREMGLMTDGAVRHRSRKEKIENLGDQTKSKLTNLSV